MNSSRANTEPGIESELLDLDAIPFRDVRELDTDVLRRALGHVVDRTSRVGVRYHTTDSTGGERID